jgi:putative ABC transport system permease protein
MVRHIVIAALRSLTRSPLLSFITIGSLAVGLMAAILTGLLIRDAVTLDHFLPGYERTYFAVGGFHNQRGDFYGTATAHDLAAYIAPFPGIAAVARVASGSGVLRRGDIQALEPHLAWADPRFFRIYRAPVLHGDLDTALDRPDGLVITRAMARKYFSRDDVVGQVLEFGFAPEYRRRPMIVRAVIRDWPPGASNITETVFASSLSQESLMSRNANTLGMSRDGKLLEDVTTIIQVTSDASLDELNRRAAALIAGFSPKSLLPVYRTLHFERGDGLTLSPKVRPDNRVILAVMLAVTLVILSLSCFNYVNLCIARSAQRGREVAIRKVAGAGRGALMAQFLGEAVVQALCALCLAVALVEWSLPAINNFLNAGAVFDYWRTPALAAGLLGGAILLGLVSGAYPALILSGFRPAATMKGRFDGIRAGLLRQAMVTLQFAALIVFLISALVVYRQNRHVTAESFQVDIGNVAVLPVPDCAGAFLEQVRGLPGVRRAACATQHASGQLRLSWAVPPLRGAGHFLAQIIPVESGFLELFDVAPLAGRLFRNDSGDKANDLADASAAPPYIINLAAVRALGYPNAQAAIGRAIFDKSVPGLTGGPRPGTIIGVVKDFSLYPLLFGSAANTPGGFAPTVYSVGITIPNLPPATAILYVRLTGRDVPQTLAAIDQAWKATGPDNPINRQFLADILQEQLAGLFKVAQAFATFTIVAMLLACFGLFGISLLAVERRIKEIGVRKAMGADSGQLLALLLWQFSRPVLWANVIAWPLAWWFMRLWLSNFPQRIALSPWFFAFAGLATLAVALLTVGGQALLVARRRPMLALRYE